MIELNDPAKRQGRSTGGMLTDDGIAVSLADRRTAILGGIQRDGLGLLASHRSPPTMQD